MAEETKVEETTVATKKTWKETVGAFLTAKGALIGGALVIVGSVLQGGTNWIDGLVAIIKSFFGA